ncbi:MAG: FecR family protein [Povalibacter sp.]
MVASTHITTDERIAEEAANWLISLEEGEADASSFAAWLEVSPRHVEEFLLCSAVWRAANGLDEAGRIDVGNLVAQARANVSRLDDDSVTRSRSVKVPPRVRRVLLSPLSAVAALLAVVAVLFIGLHDDAQRYGTGVGEQRTVKLADGSIVTLNTRSEIRVSLEKNQRAVELVSGEALFEVAHDTRRPFRVFSGAAVVQAVGTQFNVHRTESDTTVAVLQGIVEMTPLSSVHHDGVASTAAINPPERVIAGEQAQMSAQGMLLQHAAAEIDRVVAWRERRLIFRNESLGAIVAEFNRYNETQMLIEGTATSARLVTAVFDADNPGALIAFLERDPQLSVQPRGDAIVIRGP